MLEAVLWCIDNQSLLLHRFRGGDGRRGGLFLHRWKIAPAAAVDQEPEAARLEGGGRVPGGEAGGMAGGAIPPLLSDMVGTMCRFG